VASVNDFVNFKRLEAETPAAIPQ